MDPVDVRAAAVVRHRPGAAGRRTTQELTLFTGGGTGASSGLGIQFAAVANAVYAAAREAGVGRDLPTEWITQAEKP
ncbi:MAG TPA: hypothetical protein VNR59_11085 [Gaiellaceae bacterium]|nr:hypothetical protein [Gaiellaceae bacterium]